MKDDIQWFALLLLLVSGTFVGGVVMFACHEASTQRSRLETQMAEYAAAQKKGHALSPVVQCASDAGAITALGCRLEGSPRHKPGSAQAPGGGIVTHLRSGPLDIALPE
jgi:hypothetical protein